jgi:hypothetical protein
MFYLLALFSLSACATPTVFSQSHLVAYDKDTDYAVDSLNNGFTLSILYSRYQFIPESNAVLLACKSYLTTIAYDLADKNGRGIEPINEQRIRISMGRNGLTGITSCSATAIAIWKD